MRPAGSSARFTWEDLCAFPQDGRRRELIDGELYVSPSPTLRHQQLSMRLTMAIGLYLRAHPLGELVAAPLDVILSDFDVVEPDLLYVSRARGAILHDWVRGAPDLCVEILSSTSRRLDEQLKRRLYERAGVLEYWIVDPELEAVTVYGRTHVGFAHTANLSRERGGSLTTPLLPGLAIPLEDLFG